MRRIWRGLICFLVAAGCAPATVSVPVTPASHSSSAYPPDPPGLERAQRLFDAGKPAAAADHLAPLLLATGFRPQRLGDRLAARVWELSRLAEIVQELPTEDELMEIRAPWWNAHDLERQEVLAWKKRFSRDARGLQRWIRDAGPYFDDIQRVLAEYQLPPELWVITLVESGLRHDATSRARAVGPWQLMVNTARHCGVLVTVDRDERRDWLVATRGACRYFSELEASLGDGLLAMAAFNCGPGRVRREISRSGSRNVWDLKLPPETRSYVPKILALIAIIGDGATEPYRVDAAASLDYETVSLPYAVRVVDLARECGITSGELQQLNPSWTRPVTPVDGSPVLARVPAGAADDLAQKLTEKHVPEVKLSPNRVYEIQRGDTLWDVSRKFRVRLSTLLEINSLSGKEVIHPGRTIRIPG